MKPIRGAPTLLTLNGFGTSLAGKRDFHAPTGSYVTNLVLTFLFVPVLAVSAYRVIPAGGNSYHFLGKEPLSGLARRLRWLVMAGVIGGFATVICEGYFNSDGYRTDKRIQKAETYLKENDLSATASEIIPVCSHPSRGTRAVSILRETAGKAWGEGASVEQALAVSREISESTGRFLWFPDFGERLKIAAAYHARSHPKEALALMDLAVAFPGKSPIEPIRAARGEIARQWWKTEPGCAAAACAYAEELEADDKASEIRTILTPFKDHADLAGTEAARLLGGVLFRDGDFATARKLLRGYTTPRITGFHAAEKECARVFEERHHAYLEVLNQHRGPKEFYRRYEAADDERKGAIVEEYLAEQLRDDPAVKHAIDRQEQAGRLVPAVMQLGISELNLSREVTDAGERQNLLQSAEQTFLSIRGAAGETDEFRLFLGEISYWLGKHQEGRKLFDELLDSHKRASEWVLQVADRLRDVGEADSARSMIEEAWTSESDTSKKQMLASVRQVMCTDSDDRRKWLLRCDSAQGEVKAQLHSNAGELAQLAGRIDEAKAEFRKAAEVYETLPESASRLNNEALVWQNLAMLTGSVADFRKSVENIARASRLEQSSILLENLGSSYLNLANWEMNEKLLDLEIVPEMAASGARVGLAATSEEFKAAIDGLARSPHTAEARKVLSQALVMSPKNPGLYAAMAAFHVASKDHAEIKTLLEKIRAAGIDHSQALERAKPRYSGKFTKAEAEGLAKSIERNRKALDSLPADAKPGTRVLLEVAAISLENSSRLRAGGTDVADLLDRARSLHKKSPCATTNTVLGEMLGAAVLEDLRKDPAVDTIYQTNRWQLNSCDIITVLLANEATSSAAAGHPLVREAAALMENSFRIDGDDVSIRRWFWTSKMRPEDGDVMLEKIKASEFKKAFNQLAYEIAPYNPEAILYRHLMEIALGHPEEARRVLDVAAADGIRIFP
ncbi:MAG: hypothetical protein J0M04_10115 [Verrucomicrobia bacterium]|nr:hypothetical protein [Verrucomicrobiota bacterium]